MAYSNTKPETSDTAKNANGAVEVAKTSTEIVAANANRVGLEVSNVGAVDVYFSPSGTAEAKKGVRVKKESDPRVIFPGYTGKVTAILEGETKSLVTFSEI